MSVLTKVGRVIFCVLVLFIKELKIMADGGNERSCSGVCGFIYFFTKVLPSLLRAFLDQLLGSFYTVSVN